MPLGIQRLSLGMVASASAPIAASSPLQSAIACTVPMWFCTLRRFGITSSAWLGSKSMNCGWIGREVRRLLAERDREHPLADEPPTTGRPEAVFQRLWTWLMAATLLVE